MHRFFGLSKIELLAKFNTTQFPIQSNEEFLNVAKDVASQSQSLEDFQAAMDEQSQSILAQLKQDLVDCALLVVARTNVGVLDSTNPHVLRLLREPSLQSLANYFLDTPPTARNRKTSPDAVYHQPQTTGLNSSKPSKNTVKQQTVLKIQHNGVQKKTARNRAVVPTQPRRSARLNK